MTAIIALHTRNLVSWPLLAVCVCKFLKPWQWKLWLWCWLSSENQTRPACQKQCLWHGSRHTSSSLASYWSMLSCKILIGCYSLTDQIQILSVSQTFTFIITFIIFLSASLPSLLVFLSYILITHTSNIVCHLLSKKYHEKLFQFSQLGRDWAHGISSHYSW